jgi:hypothetical protein
MRDRKLMVRSQRFRICSAGAEFWGQVLCSLPDVWLHLAPATCCVCLYCVVFNFVQVLDPGGRRVSPQLALFEELVVRAYLAVSDI